MIQQINTVEDVKIFFNELLAEDVSFHPDDPFEDYVHNDTQQRLYDDQEAFVRNNLMSQAFAVCEKEDVDIYEIGLDILLPQLNEAIESEE